MASRLDDLIRDHAQRLDKLAGPIDLTDVTSAQGNGTTNVALIDIKPTWTQRDGRHRWPIIAVAAAVVAAVVAGGLMIAIRDDPIGGIPAEQPTTVAPITTVAPFWATGVFEGGRRNLRYRVPDGWKNTGWMVTQRDPLIGVMFVNADDDFFTEMSCPSGRVSPPVGRTVDDLVSAWANLPGVDATAPRDVTVFGSEEQISGKRIELTVPDSNEDSCAGMYFRCSFGGQRQGQGRCENLLQTPTWTGDPQTVPNQRREIWVLDDDGTRLMIMAWSVPDISQQDRTALDELLASIRID